MDDSMNDRLTITTPGVKINLKHLLNLQTRKYGHPGPHSSYY